MTKDGDRQAPSSADGSLILAAQAAPLHPARTLVDRPARGHVLRQPACWPWTVAGGSLARDNCGGHSGRFIPAPTRALSLGGSTSLASRRLFGPVAGAIGSSSLGGAACWEAEGGGRRPRLDPMMIKARPSQYRPLSPGQVTLERWLARLTRPLQPHSPRQRRHRPHRRQLNPMASEAFRPPLAHWR